MSTHMLSYMAKRRQRARAYSSHYPLTEVVKMINNGQVVVRRDVSRDAFQLFGWTFPDIEDAYRKLQPRHFYKTEESKWLPGVYLDFYKATINGERIYTHFYFNRQSKLVINSLHRQ